MIKFLHYPNLLLQIKTNDHLLASEQPTLLKAEPNNSELLIQDLIKKGHLTKSQVQVGRYDQEMTGTALLEALVARGWLAQELLDDCWL